MFGYDKCCNQFFSQGERLAQSHVNMYDMILWRRGQPHRWQPNDFLPHVMLHRTVLLNRFQSNPNCIWSFTTFVHNELEPLSSTYHLLNRFQFDWKCQMCHFHLLWSNLISQNDAMKTSHTHDCMLSSFVIYWVFLTRCLLGTKHRPLCCCFLT